MASAEIQVDVVYCPRPGVTESVALTLPEGATLDDALRTSGLLGRHQLMLDAVAKGIWCKLKAGDTRLRDRDRCEIYRPLTVDPKEARRLRYRRDKDRNKA